MSAEAPLQRRPRKPFDWSTAFIAIVVAVAAIVVYWRDGHARFIEILVSDVSLFVDILPKVLAACLIAAFVAVLMPREAVRALGRCGIRVARPHGRDAGGCGLPGGPITIFPIAAAFTAIGADVGATVAFITSWTLLGYARALVWELPLLGSDFVLWRIVVALPLPLVAGLLARMIVTIRQNSIGGGAVIYFVDALLWIIALALALVAACAAAGCCATAPARA